MTRADLIDMTVADPLRLAAFDLSDLGNAQRLIARAAERLLHDRATGWLGWCGTHWEREAGEDLALRLAHEVAQALPLEARAMAAEAEALKRAGGDAARIEVMEKRAEALFGWAVTSGNAVRSRAMLDQAAAYLAVREGEMDPDPLALACRNGTLRLARAAGDGLDVRFRQPPDPADRITRLAGVDYDPDAGCPGWEAFLAEVLPIEAVRRHFQKWMGYLCTGHTHEQRFLILQGRGGDGKSTAMNVVRRVLGGYAATVAVETFLDDRNGRGGAQASPDLARLAGDVRLAVTSEPKRGARLNEGLIKLITGGGRLLARHLNRDPFEYTPAFKIVFEVNPLPVIHDDGAGTWRRVDLINFPVQIPEHRQDRLLEARLVETEGPGILNWLLDGVRDWLSDGLSRPDAVREAIDDYRRTSSPFGEWLAERVERAEGVRTLASAFFADFKAWAEANGHEVTMSQASFGRALADQQIINAGKDAQGRKLRRGARLRAGGDNAGGGPAGVPAGGDDGRLVF